VYYYGLLSKNEKEGRLYGAPRAAQAAADGLAAALLRGLTAASHHGHGE
jgi:hypothetical protein